MADPLLGATTQCRVAEYPCELTDTLNGADGAVGTAEGSATGWPSAVAVPMALMAATVNPTGVPAGRPVSSNQSWAPGVGSREEPTAPAVSVPCPT